MPKNILDDLGDIECMEDSEMAGRFNRKMIRELLRGRSAKFLSFFLGMQGALQIAKHTYPQGGQRVDEGKTITCLACCGVGEKNCK